jgi:hypothetical protein
MATIEVSPTSTLDDVQGCIASALPGVQFSRMGPTLVARRTAWVGSMVNLHKGKVRTSPSAGHMWIMFLYPLLVLTLFGLIFLVPRLKEQGKLRDQIDSALQAMACARCCRDDLSVGGAFPGRRSSIQADLRR